MSVLAQLFCNALDLASDQALIETYKNETLQIETRKLAHQELWKRGMLYDEPANTISNVLVGS